jgi:hypothetical protein
MSLQHRIFIAYTKLSSDVRNYHTLETLKPYFRRSLITMTNAQIEVTMRKLVKTNPRARYAS